MTNDPGYLPRVIEAELDDLLNELPAIAIEGPKAVGKTATASTRSASSHELDDPAQLEVIRAAPERITQGVTPILIDEWQRFPQSWDVVRRAVDADRSPGRFILTGSMAPEHQPTHSGAGRIVTMRMRPMTLPERGAGIPTVSLSALLAGGSAIGGETTFALEDYVEEILSSGFPGLRGLTRTGIRAGLDGYLDRIIERDFSLLGREVRNPAALRRWMTAYAAATATTATSETIRDAAAGADGTRPSRTTVVPYIDALQNLWIVDELPAWFPMGTAIRRVTGPPKHHLADPALAARLLNVSADALLKGRDVGPRIPRNGTLLGALFESLTCLSVRVFAQAAGADVSHFRTKSGEREADLIVEADDSRFVAVEVKLSQTVSDADTKHLRWLRDQVPERFIDAVVVSTGHYAYRRQDGIAVVPLALLGP